MISNDQIKQLKTQYCHLFEVEENGNLTLRSDLGVPPFKLIFVEGGEYSMGDNIISNAQEHKVKLSSFFIAEYPVTNELYKAVTGNNPNRFEGINHPVEQVSWYDAVEFCEILNKKLQISPGFYDVDKINKDKNNRSENDKLKWTVNFNQLGNGFRLPTEAEWEYAARGGLEILSISSLQYSGSDHLNEVGWHRENNVYETKPVGLKFPNCLGIHDLSGNVWEWCWDWYSEYDKKVIENPTGAKDGSVRVMRGGSWNSNAEDCRLTPRGSYWPIIILYNFGFRQVFAMQFS
jgi:formylglycine-generating enzyme